MPTLNSISRQIFSLCSEQEYIKDYHETSDIDRRYLFNWKKFAQDIRADPKSSPSQQFWAQVLLDAFVHACYNPDIYAEWHHLTALCMFGSVEDARNYIRLPPGWHLKVHFALCFFFPSHLGLAYSVRMMIETGKARMKNKISPKEFGKYMIVLENISTEFAQARILMYQEHSKFMQNNHHRLQLKNASMRTEAKRLMLQRKRLRESGIMVNSGEYTQFEVDLYCQHWPDLVGQITFTHFPIWKRYESMEQLTLKGKDVVINGQYNRRANVHLKQIVALHSTDYEAMPSRTKKTDRPKQLLKNKILDEMMADGYRFVIGYKRNCEQLNHDQKKTTANSYVQATKERAIIMIENCFATYRKSKKRPTTGKENIVSYFKKPKNPPNNDEASDNRKPPAIR